MRSSAAPMARASAVSPSPGAPLTVPSATTGLALPCGSGASLWISLARAGAAGFVKAWAMASPPRRQASSLAVVLLSASLSLRPSASLRVQETTMALTPPMAASVVTLDERRKLRRLDASVLAGTSACCSAAAMAEAMSVATGCGAPVTGSTRMPALSGGVRMDMARFTSLVEDGACGAQAASARASRRMPANRQMN